MGNSNSSISTYNKPVTDPKEGETAIYRHQDFTESLLTEPEAGMNTYTKILKRSFRKFGDRPYLGRRCKNADGTNEDSYTWETYKEVEVLGKSLGSGLINKGLIEVKEQYQHYKLKFVSVYSLNSREWILLDVACALYGLTLVPIYDTLGEEATEVMFGQTELPTLFLTCNHIKAMAEGMQSGTFPHLKTLIVMDPENLDSDLKEVLEGIVYFTFDQIIEAGEDKHQEYVEVTPDDISFFSYTSGTTGTPKGAMIAHKNIASTVAGAHALIPEFEMKHISYLPLAHVFERVVLSLIIFRGGQYGLFSGDVRKIKDDLAILKPTIFVSVPRMYNKLFDKIMQGINSKTGL